MHRQCVPGFLSTCEMSLGSRLTQSIIIIIITIVQFTHTYCLCTSCVVHNITDVIVHCHEHVN